MKASRRAVTGVVMGSLALACAAVTGCSRRPPAAPKPEAVGEAPGPPFESSVPPAMAAQHRAQHAWCSYLDALYHRAMQDGSTWGLLARCNAYTSTASPEMVERTVACSRQALEGFTGDPFTDAYAEEVKRCGSSVIDAMAFPAEDVEPYVAVLCERAAACGAAQNSQCRADVARRVGKRLGRALGALNPSSRIALRQCLQKAECQDAAEQVTGCLDPILDRLLWTPN
jgi:hypothetical protein